MCVHAPVSLTPVPCSHAQNRPLHRPAGIALPAAAGSTLVGGCSGALSQQAGNSGVWWFLIVALLLATALAFGLGRLLAQLDQNKSLRAMRSTLTAWQQCLGAEAWQTDAAHQLHAPGMSSPADWAADPAFQQALQARLPFDHLLVSAHGAEAGSAQQAKAWSI